MKKNILNLIMLFFSVSMSLTACAQRTVYSRNVTVVKTVPRGGAVVVHGGISYRYVNGVYYRPYGSGFRIVTPPLGLQVRVLPSVYTTITLAGQPYFVSGGIYYTQTEPGCYVVVQKPVESAVAEDAPSKDFTATQYAMVPSLPQGTSAVTINNKRYYKVNDMYYEKVLSENGEAGYVVVSKLQ